MTKRQKKALLIFLTMLSIPVIYLTQLSIHIINTEGEDKTYCGTVIEKRGEEVGYKSHLDDRLIIDFGGKYGYKTIDVTEDTYINTKVGENVCFDIATSWMGDTDYSDYFFSCAWLFIMSVVTIILVCVYIIAPIWRAVDLYLSEE